MPAFAEVAGKFVRLGKREPRHDPRTLELASYLPSKLPRLKPVVKRSPAVQNWGEMGNDTYGDCTCAAAGHAIQLTSAVGSGAIASPSDPQILDAYWATGNPPTPGADDNGRFELDVLNYWRTTGIGGHLAHAYAAIDLAHLHGQVRRTIDLFGFCYIGVALPRSAQQQTTWTVVQGPDAEPGSWGGHAIILVDYDRKSVTCVTWGHLVQMSWQFFLKYCDEAYAVILLEWLNAQGQTIEGFDLASLDADLAALAA